MKRNENGFGILEIFLLIAIFGILGVVSWYTLKALTDKTSSSTNQPVSETTKASPRLTPGYALYDKNPNFTIEYPKYWNIETSDIDVNNQDIYFYTSDFVASEELHHDKHAVSSDTYTVSKGAQFYVNITNQGLPANLTEIRSNLAAGINNVAPVYKAKGMSFQEPKILKTSSGLKYVGFIGHSSLISPVNNSSNAIFLTKKYGIMLSYNYPDRKDTVSDPLHANEFHHFVESLRIK